MIQSREPTPDENEITGSIDPAKHEMQQDRCLAAARLVRAIPINERSEEHMEILRIANHFEEVLSELTSEPKGGDWIKLNEFHDGTYDTVLYYKLDESSRLMARLETPLNPSMVIPLLSVFNETDLYATWLPRWERPICLGLRYCKLIRQPGRCHQVISAVTDLPWPWKPRQCNIEVTACDDLDAQNMIVVTMDSLDNDPDIPTTPGVVQIEYKGGIVFRPCPMDHPAWHKSKRTDRSNKVLVSLTMMVDPKVSFIPVSIVNFVTRTVLGTMWKSMLKVAEQVRDGSRPEHAKAIQQKRELLYDYLEMRVEKMMSSLKEMSTMDAISIPDNPAPVNKEELNHVLAFL
jgi:hypothetical protein